MQVMYSIRSHKGKIRDNNEDNFFANGITLLSDYGNRPYSFDAASSSPPIILAVCDGMGGEESGELASQIVVKNLLMLQNQIETASSRDYEQIVKACVEAANIEISSYGKRSGTTLALVVIDKKSAYCFSIGDSRIYLLKSREFLQVSNDHTQGAEIAKKGIIPMEQARQGNNGNKLTRCIGIGNCCYVDSYPAISGIYRLLLCSDGLPDMVTDGEIKRILTECEPTPEAADLLMQNALDAGGKDNITIVIADVVQSNFIGRLFGK